MRYMLDTFGLPWRRTPIGAIEQISPSHFAGGLIFLGFL